MMLNADSVLRRARREAGLKQKDVAELLGITQSRYSRFELGKSLIPSDLYEKLEEVLPLSAAEVAQKQESTDKFSVYGRIAKMAKSIDDTDILRAALNKMVDMV